MAAKFGTSRSLEELKTKLHDVGSRLRWFEEPADVLLGKVKVFVL